MQWSWAFSVMCEVGLSKLIQIVLLGVTYHMELVEWCYAKASHVTEAL